MNVAPGFAAENLAGVDDHELIAVDHGSLIVHRADAVGVAVEGHAQIRALFFDGLHQLRQILGHRGIGMMIGEAAVHVEEQLSDVAIQLLENAMHDRTGSAVAAIGDDFHAPVEAKLRGDLIHVRRDHIRESDGARATSKSRASIILRICWISSP